MKTVLTALLLALVATTLAAQSQDPKATLGLEPRATLPGIPVTFRFTITNSTPKAIRLPKKALLHVSPLNGESFISRGESSRLVADLAQYIEPDAVPPAASVSFSIPLDPSLMSPPWFFDARLCQPGGYKLRVLLSDHLNEDAVRGKPAFDVLSSKQSSIVTDEVLLTVVEPTGVDAEVWRHLVQEAGGHEFNVGMWGVQGFGLAKTIWAKYPNATYARFVAAKVPAATTEDRLKIVRAAIAADPNGPLVEWYTLHTATLEALTSGHAVGVKKDRAKAKLHADRAKETFSVLIATAREPMVRKLAREGLEGLNEELELDGIR